VKIKGAIPFIGNILHNSKMQYSKPKNPMYPKERRKTTQFIAINNTTKYHGKVNKEGIIKTAFTNTQLYHKIYLVIATIPTITNYLSAPLADSGAVLTMLR